MHIIQQIKLLRILKRDMTRVEYTNVSINLFDEMISIYDEGLDKLLENINRSEIHFISINGAVIDWREF